MAKKIIHVNRHFIAINAKLGQPVLPCYSVKTGGRNRYGFEINIKGPSKLVDTRTCSQLSCGARAWIETDAQVEIVGEMTFAEVKQLKEKHKALKGR